MKNRFFELLNNIREEEKLSILAEAGTATKTELNQLKKLSENNINEINFFSEELESNTEIRNKEKWKELSNKYDSVFIADVIYKLEKAFKKQTKGYEPIPRYSYKQKLVNTIKRESQWWD